VWRVAAKAVRRQRWPATGGWLLTLANDQFQASI